MMSLSDPNINRMKLVRLTGACRDLPECVYRQIGAYTHTQLNVLIMHLLITVA